MEQLGSQLTGIVKIKKSSRHRPLLARNSRGTGRHIAMNLGKYMVNFHLCEGFDTEDLLHFPWFKERELKLHKLPPIEL